MTLQLFNTRLLLNTPDEEEPIKMLHVWCP